MSQFPIENTPGLYEGVNYLLSGPSGLGQNFQGFASYTPAYLTSTFRAPFTIPTTGNVVPSWYVSPIPLSNATPLDVNIDGQTNTVQFDFASVQPGIPFLQRERITISDVDPDFYNDRYNVFTCTDSNVIIKTNSLYTWPPYVSGGNVSYNNSDTFTSTDCNARVTVYGPTDQVFISSQLTMDFTYTASTASTFDVTVAINRYKGFPDTSTPGAQDYLFDFDATISQQTRSFSVSTSGSSLADEFIFTTVLDQPSFGYYWYICEVMFSPTSGDVKPGVFTVGLRSLTAQVIKQ